MNINDLTALAGIYRKQAGESTSEFVRWAHKTIRGALDYIEALETVAEAAERHCESCNADQEYACNALCCSLGQALDKLKEAGGTKCTD
jgi:hypothetical protein